MIVMPTLLIFCFNLSSRKYTSLKIKFWLPAVIHDHLILRLWIEEEWTEKSKIMSELFNSARTIPDWMNQSFFERVIRHVEKDPKAEVFDIEIGAACKPGNNFASSIFRVKITFKSKFTKEAKTISTIVKIQPTHALIEGVTENWIFRNEMEMFDKVLPEVQALWLSVDDKSLLCPK